MVDGSPISPEIDEARYTRRWIRTSDGVDLHTVSCGTRGPLVLFLHGFPEHWRAWQGQLDALGPDHRAVALDLRGYNLSGKPTSVAAYRIDRLVADVLTVLDAVAPGERCVLVGHDWGGLIAWEVARAHPQRLSRLVIINAPHPRIFLRELRQNAAQRQASSYVLVFRRRWLAEALLRAFRFWLLRRNVFGQAASPAAFPPPLRAAYLEAWRRPYALTGGLNYYRANGIRDVEEGRDEEWVVDVPTLVLWGERDPTLLTGNLDGLQRFVPCLRIVRWPEGTHWVVHELPERVNRELRAVLANVRA